MCETKVPPRHNPVDLWRWETHDNGLLHVDPITGMLDVRGEEQVKRNPAEDPPQHSLATLNRRGSVVVDNRGQRPKNVQCVMPPDRQSKDIPHANLPEYPCTTSYKRMGRREVTKDVRIVGATERIELDSLSSMSQGGGLEVNAFALNPSTHTRQLPLRGYMRTTHHWQGG